MTCMPSIVDRREEVVVCDRWKRRFRSSGGEWDRLRLAPAMRIYPLKASSGAKIWSDATGDGVYSSLAVANGVVYVGSYNHLVYALDASAGSSLWVYTTGDHDLLITSRIQWLPLHRIRGQRRSLRLRALGRCLYLPERSGTAGCASEMNRVHRGRPQSPTGSPSEVFEQPQTGGPPLRVSGFSVPGYAPLNSEEPLSVGAVTLPPGRMATTVRARTRGPD